MADPVGSKETQKWQTFHARLQSFEQSHQLSKRRASSQSKGKKNAHAITAEWPHESPSPDRLAKAGFFYAPAQDSLDNVKCFSCGVKLDGWEPEDDPLHEHLSHTKWCAWAVSLSVARAPGHEEEETRDPMSDMMVAARQGTFEIGSKWPHENARGWKCKTKQMVEAGWTMDPSPEMEDGVTCMYCSLSLDGWEPKDDPFEEHKRRSPDCQFFVLVDRYYGSAASVKMKKEKAQSSAASKVSRMSSQSMMSVASEVPSMLLGDEGVQGDDSVMSTVSTTKGKKEAGRKPAAKGAKGRERANIAADDDMPELEVGVESELHVVEPIRATRKRTQTSKQPDSSVMEPNHVEAPPKKPGRPRRAKAKPEPEARPEAEQQSSATSAQIQQELGDSISQEAPDGESTPHIVQPKRGTKRTSDGLKKEPESSILDEFPDPPKSKRAPGRPSKQTVQAQESVVEGSSVEPYVDVSQSDAGSKPKKTAKAKKGKGRKASSSRSSRATVTEAEPEPEEPEDLARDEAEIEAELQRIASEQALQTEQEKVEEYESTPSNRAEKHAEAILQLETELAAETAGIRDPSEELANFVATVAEQRLPSPSHNGQANQALSPSGSNKENDPSSSFADPATAVKTTATTNIQIINSPTKTTRIPLAPGTPNRAPLSPTKHLSPSKRIVQLTSSHTWIPIDIENALTASPMASPGTIGERLANAAGALTSPEKGMTVEQWVRWRAEIGEKELRRRCEECVGVFEKEGVRALEGLRGIGLRA